MNDLVICDKFSFDRVAGLCQANGYGIEIQSFYDMDCLSKSHRVIDIRRESLKNIPLRSMHGPHGDLFPGEFDPQARHTAGERYCKAVEIAGKLNIGHMVMHCGHVPGASQSNGWLKQFTAFWRDFLAYVPESICFHLENMLEHDPSLISDAVASVEHSRVDVCLDVGHAYCCSRINVLEWIRRLAPQIGYVHLHDNHGEKDEHLALGCGTIPMTDVCHALCEYAPDAIWALEVDYNAVRPSLDWLKGHGFI